MDSELFYNFRIERLKSNDNSYDKMKEQYQNVIETIVFTCKNCQSHIEFPNETIMTMYSNYGRKAYKKLTFEEILQFHLMECVGFQERIDKRRKWEEEQEIKSRL